MDLHTIAGARMADYRRIADEIAQERAALRAFDKPRKRKRTVSDYLPPRKPAPGPVNF